MNTETKRLDKLFSEFIRRRAISEVGGCQKCLIPKFDTAGTDGSIYPAWKRLQCSHFHGRRKKSVRWDEENAVGLCGACHFHLTANPSEHTDFFKQRLGEQAYDLLQKRADTPQKIDKKIVELYLKAKLAELK